MPRSTMPIRSFQNPAAAAGVGQRNMLGSGCAGESTLVSPTKTAAVSEQTLKTSRIEPLAAQAGIIKATSHEQFSPSHAKDRLMPRGEQSASLSLGSCMKKGAWRCQSDQGSEGRI